MIFDAVFAMATSCWPDHSGQWRGGAAVCGDCGGSDQSVLIIIINGCHTIYTHTPFSVLATPLLGKSACFFVSAIEE